jgi:tetrahydromethanopterin S-methyltransferase subunit G
MVEDKPENIEPSPDSGRAKRPPPTIDLEASEVSDQAPDISADAEPKRSSQWFWRGAISSAVIAALCGACAAALVIGVIWLLAWSPGMTPSAPAEPNINAAAIDDLTARITSIESKANKAVAPTPDPAVAARLDEVEKAVGAMRGEIAGLRVQSEKLASAINDIKSAPRESAVSPDLAEINERIAGIERATRAQSAEIAQENSKPADDVPLRRVVTAALLETVVRTGDPYPAALAAAKPLAPDPNLL